MLCSVYALCHDLYTHNYNYMHTNNCRGVDICMLYRVGGGEGGLVALLATRHVGGLGACSPRKILKFGAQRYHLRAFPG